MIKRFKKNLVYILVFIHFPFFCFSSFDSGKDSADILNSTHSNPIISAIDSLQALKLFESSDFTTDRNILNTNNFIQDHVPVYADLVFEYRIAELDRRTPIELEYKDIVKDYIDLYTIQRRADVSRILGLAELYFPLFEEMLDKYDLPLELKYLAIVESALNPLARSSSGAVGLWQFLLNTSKMFDLKVNSYIDERRDPHRSTDAACRYLEYLYRIFNDWQLTLAAYNGGPGVVRNAIQRSGGKTDFWELMPYLPEQTQDYVPAFIAVNYVMNHAADHNIYPVEPKIFYYETDTVKITHSVSFRQISEVIGVSVSMITFLNPSFRRNYIPYYGKPEILVLPANKITDFLKYEKEIYGYNISGKNYNTLVAGAGNKTNRIKIVHTVKKGEYFHKIAINYKTTIEDLKAWNNLSSNNLNTGQKLEIWVATVPAGKDNPYDHISLEKRTKAVVTTTGAGSPQVSSLTNR